MEKLRNIFIANMQESGMDPDEINRVIRLFDVSANGFRIEEEPKALIVAGGFPEVAKVYLAACHVEGISENTIYNYMLTLKIFFREVNVPLDKINANHIRQFLYAYREQRKISLRSLDGVRRILSSFFSWLANEEYINSNPMKTIKPIKYEKKQRHFLDRMNLEKLRRSCKSLRDIAVLDALYSTGCRVSELVSIKISDIDFLTGEIVVTGKGRKQRSVYLNASANLSINAYINSRKDDNPYLFVSNRAPHNSLSSKTIERIFRRLSEDSKVENVSPHVIRHTTATMALRSGMPVQNIQQLLGHSNIATTMIYAETDTTQVKADHTRCVV